MRISVAAALAIATLVAGCDSNLNPVNWFNRDGAPPVTEAAEGETRGDPRPTVDQVVSVTTDRVPGGVLVTAVGLPPTQGWFAADLVPQLTDISDRAVPENGVITFRFAVVPPRTPQPVGTQASRELTAGTTLTDSQIAGVRSIVVLGERSQRSARP